MMNSLNSVLIEGYVKKGIETGEDDLGRPWCSFDLVSYRYVRESGEMVQRETVVAIMAYGAIAKGCVARLNAGRGVRVVGCIQSDYQDGGGLHIEAEHIEIQPKRKKASTKEVA